MTSCEVETLVRRVARMSDGWTNGRLSIRQVTRMDLSQAVTWLKLAAGQWLLVASSDSYTSRLCCFDVSLALSRSTNPLAECFFEGPIKTACVEIQDDHIIVSIGVGHP
jgi:hypothetical protein